MKRNVYLRKGDLVLLRFDDGWLCGVYERSPKQGEYGYIDKSFRAMMLSKVVMVWFMYRTKPGCYYGMDEGKVLEKVQARCTKPWGVKGTVSGR